MANKELSDKVFLKKLNEILENEYSKEDFGVKELASEIGLSHTQLHRKIQSEFGKSTSQYIREFRLLKALKLLQENVISASEVAYRVGFSSPTYFNRSFNNFFGYPPGQTKYNTSDDTGNEQETHDDVKYRQIKGSKFDLTKWKRIWGLILIIVLVLIAIYLFYIKNNFKTLTDKTVDEISVAVLPFKNLSDDNSNQYFADGVMDDVITHLSNIKELRVISRTTMDQYKESNKSVPEIAEELDVSFIIESTIQKYQDSVRLIIQLIDAENDKNIWAQDFRREFKNIFSLESEIAKKVAAELKATISPNELAKIEEAPTKNMEAYDLYLKGIYAFNSNNVDSLIEYEKLLYRCLDLDPDFAMAYAALARSKIQRMRGLRLPVTKENVDEVKALAIKSIELNNNARAHASLGWLYLWIEWNWEEAEKQFKLAIQIDPNYAGGHVYLSEFLYYIKGDFTEARKHLDKALFLAPYAYYPRSVSATFYLNEGNFNQSIEEAKKMKAIDENNLSAYRILFLNYVATGEENMAVDELLEGWKMSPENSDYIPLVNEIYKQSGIQGIYQWLITNEINSEVNRPFNLAYLYSLRGEKDNAIKWIEKSYELHDPSTPYIKHHYYFKDLHSDERFLAIIEKLNLGSY